MVNLYVQEMGVKKRTSSKWNTRSSSQTFSKVRSRHSTKTYMYHPDYGLLVVRARSKDVLGSSQESQARSQHHPRQKQSKAWRSTDIRPATSRLGLRLWGPEMPPVLEHQGNCRGQWDENRRAKISFGPPFGKTDAEECKTWST